MKNAVFWDVAPSGFCFNRRSGATFASKFRAERIIVLRKMRAVTRSMLDTVNFISSSQILSITEMEAISSSGKWFQHEPHSATS
jgi:hypothetical protein